MCPRRFDSHQWRPDSKQERILPWLEFIALSRAWGPGPRRASALAVEMWLMEASLLRTRVPCSPVSTRQGAQGGRHGCDAAQCSGRGRGGEAPHLCAGPRLRAAAWPTSAAQRAASARGRCGARGRPVMRCLQAKTWCAYRQRGRGCACAQGDVERAVLVPCLAALPLLDELKKPPTHMQAHGRSSCGGCKRCVHI